MANFKPIKCTEAQMNSKAKIEGQIFFTTDTNKIYLDKSSSLREEYCSMLSQCVSATLTNISTQYKFILNDNGYFINNNAKQGANNSYVLGRVKFYAKNTGTILLSYRSYGESGYDYGIFGQLDQTLSESYTDDGTSGSTKVLVNCKGGASSEYKQITYNITTIGEHFFDVKYRKDSSSDSNDDTLQFQLMSSDVIDNIILKDDNNDSTTEEEKDYKIFIWDGQSNTNNSSNIALWQKIYDNAKNSTSIIFIKKSISDITSVDSITLCGMISNISLQSNGSYTIKFDPILNYDGSQGRLKYRQYFVNISSNSSSKISTVSGLQSNNGDLISLKPVSITNYSSGKATWTAFTTYVPTGYKIYSYQLSDTLYNKILNGNVLIIQLMKALSGSCYSSIFYGGSFGNQTPGQYSDPYGDLICCVSDPGTSNIYSIGITINSTSKLLYLHVPTNIDNSDHQIFINVI